MCCTARPLAQEAGLGTVFLRTVWGKARSQVMIFDQGLKYDCVAGRISALLMPQVAGAAIFRQMAAV